MRLLLLACIYHTRLIKRNARPCYTKRWRAELPFSFEYHAAPSSSHVLTLHFALLLCLPV